MNPVCSDDSVGDVLLFYTHLMFEGYRAFSPSFSIPQIFLTSLHFISSIALYVVQTYFISISHYLILFCPSPEILLNRSEPRTQHIVQDQLIILIGPPPRPKSLSFFPHFLIAVPRPLTGERNRSLRPTTSITFHNSVSHRQARVLHILSTLFT